LEPRTDCRTWSRKVQWCLSSFAGTGDPSASASWRITASNTAKFARRARASLPSRSTGSKNPKQCARSCGCHFQSCVTRNAVSCSNGIFTTHAKRAASQDQPFSSSIVTAPCATTRSTAPPHVSPRQRSCAFFNLPKKRGPLAAKCIGPTLRTLFAPYAMPCGSALTRPAPSASAAHSSRGNACVPVLSAAGTMLLFCDGQKAHRRSNCWNLDIFWLGVSVGQYTGSRCNHRYIPP